MKKLFLAVLLLSQLSYAGDSVLPLDIWMSKNCENQDLSKRKEQKCKEAINPEASPRLVEIKFYHTMKASGDMSDTKLTMTLTKKVEGTDEEVIGAFSKEVFSIDMATHTERVFQYNLDGNTPVRSLYLKVSAGPLANFKLSNITITE